MSIYIVPNTTNKIVLTLAESSTLVNPFYLFEFENKFNHEKIYWSVPNEATGNRFDLFTMIESTTGSTTGGTTSVLSLAEGQYTYNVYESSTQTLEVSQTTSRIVETGRMVVATNTFINVRENNEYNPYL